MLRVWPLVALGMLACRNEPSEHARGAGTARSARSAVEATPSAPSRPTVPSPSTAGVPSVAAALANLGEPAGSCDWSDVVSTCFEAVGATSGAREAAFRALGQLCKSVPTRDPCPRERRVGSCRNPDGFVEHYYAAGSRPYSADDARAECQSRDGRWLGSR